MSARDEFPDVRTVSGEVEEAPVRQRLPERRRDAGALSAAMPGVESPHAKRFQIFTGILLALAIAAVAVAGMVLLDGGGGGAGTSTAWSAFKPSSDGLDTGAQEIADYVGRQYQLPNGQQIVAVTGGR